MRRAHTLPELVLTLTLIAILAAMSVPTLVAAIDQWQVRGAVADLVNALVVAREAALARGMEAVFVVDAARGEVTVTCDGDTLAHRAVGALHGVTISASGDMVRYAPDGLAIGVSNTTLVVARRARVDSVVVSRLGRVRWTR